MYYTPTILRQGKSNLTGECNLFGNYHRRPISRNGISSATDQNPQLFLLMRCSPLKKGRLSEERDDPESGFKKHYESSGGLSQQFITQAMTSRVETTLDRSDRAIKLFTHFLQAIAVDVE